jgi:hypothetical protein
VDAGGLEGGVLAAIAFEHSMRVVVGEAVDLDGQAPIGPQEIDLIPVPANVGQNTARWTMSSRFVAMYRSIVVEAIPAASTCPRETRPRCAPAIIAIRSFLVPKTGASETAPSNQTKRYSEPLTGVGWRYRSGSGG